MAMIPPVAPRPEKVSIDSVCEHLSSAIAAGNPPVGQLLPTEIELARHYATSRHTIREALARMELSGLISRTKNVGTRVLTSRPTRVFRPSLTSVDELVQFGTEHVRVVQQVQEVVAQGTLSEDLGLPAGSRWLRISSLRQVGEGGTSLPIGWTDVYVAIQYADVAADVLANPTTLISTLIESRHGRQIAEIRQDVRASVMTDKAMADRLHVALEAPVLRITRRYLDQDGDLLQASVTVHPADRFSLSMRLQRTTAAGGRAA